MILSWRAIRDEALESTLNSHLELFSTEGLRTLVLAERYLDEDEYKAWDAKYKAALLELDDRQEKGNGPKTPLYILCHALSYSLQCVCFEISRLNSFTSSKFR